LRSYYFPTMNEPIACHQKACETIDESIQAAAWHRPYPFKKNVRWIADPYESGVWSQPIHVQWVRRPEAKIKLNFESIDCLWHNYWQKYTGHSVSPISLLKTNAGLLMGPCGQLGKKSPTNPRAMDQATRLIVENKSFFLGFPRLLPVNINVTVHVPWGRKVLTEKNSC
jgi:hypothetical protein